MVPEPPIKTVVVEGAHDLVELEHRLIAMGYNVVAGTGYTLNYASTRGLRGTKIAKAEPVVKNRRPGPPKLGAGGKVRRW